MKTKRSIRILFLLAGVALMWFSSGGNAYGQDATQATIGGSNTTSASANVTRVSTMTVPSFLPFTTIQVHVREEYSGDMGTMFTYSPFSGFTYSNLTYVANAGVICSHDANYTITCTGDITQVTINFDFEYLVNDYSGDNLLLGWSGDSTGYPLNYTIHLIYPGPLTYVAPYNTDPISVTGAEVTWHQEDTYKLVGYALFRDPRIKLAFLPLAKR